MGEGSIPALLVIHLCEGEYPSIHLRREVYPISSYYTCLCSGGGERVFFSFCCVSMEGKVFPFFLLCMYVGESVFLLLLYMCLGANIATKTVCGKYF